METKVLSAADILGAEDITIHEVNVPEWGGVVRLRPMTSDEALAFQGTADKKLHSAVRIIVMCAVDENGRRIFTEEDVDKLRKKGLASLMRIQKAALKINGLTDDAVETVKND